MVVKEGAACLFVVTDSQQHGDSLMILDGWAKSYGVELWGHKVIKVMESE